MRGVLTKDIVFVFLATLLFFSGFNLLMPTFPLYIASLGGSERIVGLLGGLITFAAVIQRPFLAKWSDRIGRRKLLLWSGFFAATGPLLYLLHDAFWYLFLARTYHALSLGGYIVASQTLLIDLAPASKRGTVMGWYGVMGGLSMAVFPAVGFAIIEHWGYGWLFAVGALLSVGIILAGLPIREPAVSPARAEDGPPTKVRMRGPLLLSALAIASITAVLGAVNAFLPLYGIHLGVGNVGIYFTVLALLHMVGGMVSGDLSDRIGRFPVALPSFLLVATGMGILPMASLSGGAGYVLFLTSAALVGMGVSSVGAVMLAHAMDLVETQHRSQVVAHLNNAFDLGLSAGAMALGPVAAISFSILWLILAGSALAGFVMTLVQRRQHPV